MNMATIIGGVVGMLAVAILILVYGTILPNLNQAAIGASSYSMLQIVPVIAVGIGLLGLVISAFGGSLR